MSTTETATEEVIDITEEVAAGATAPAPEGADDKGDDEPITGNKEAAKYRTRLRETEAERDTLTGQLEAAHKHIAEGLAAKAGLPKPAALWATGLTVADALDDAGNVDPAKIATHVAEVKESLGIHPVGNHVPREGNNSTHTASDSWSKAFGA